MMKTPEPVVPPADDVPISQNEPNAKPNTNSAYKRAYNNHRRKPGDPLWAQDLHDLVDFSYSSSSSHPPNQHYKVVPLSIEPVKAGGVYYDGPLFGIQSHPGFVYAPQALSHCLQTRLAYLALTQFCESPHATNIDSIHPKCNNHNTASMWELWQTERQRNSQKDGHSHNDKQNDHSNSNGNKNSNNNRNNKRSLRNLSWATMGYQYDWTARAYREESKSPMPPSLATLGSYFAHIHHKLTTPTRVTTPSSSIFTASAAIVNYYSTKSNMGGHRDDLELDFTKPVISISLGLSAVFLLGGHSSKDHGPVVPILVRPGDVMMLGGESRLCYHGVARILPKGIDVVDGGVSSVGCIPGKKNVGKVSILSLGDGDDLESVSISESDRITLNDFLWKHRININVRQVLPNHIKTIPPNYNAALHHIS